jgi:hypothetical protein
MSLARIMFSSASSDWKSDGGGTAVLANEVGGVEWARRHQGGSVQAQCCKCCEPRAHRTASSESAPECATVQREVEARKMVHHFGAPLASKALPFTRAPLRFEQPPFVVFSLRIHALAPRFARLYRDVTGAASDVTEALIAAVTCLTCSVIHRSSRNTWRPVRTQSGECPWSLGGARVDTKKNFRDTVIPRYRYPK